MKSYVYTFDNEHLGVILTIEAELVDYEDHDPPFVVIQEISYGDKPLELWCFSEAFIKSLENHVFQLWCKEVQ